jgi:NADPH:quinone reductase-like Zn-dependent oxidoreductase
MKSAFAKEGAGLDAIRIIDVPRPSPSPGEVLVRLHAATLNFRDLLFAKGILSGMTKQPDYVPLSCAAGAVVELGDSVDRVRIGDRVQPIFFQGVADGRSKSAHMLGGNTDGVARAYGVFPSASLCKLPDELGDLEAATLPCAGLTAWSAIFGARPIHAGEWVLLQGTGGVSLAALQWAKAAGAQVLLTSSSDAKLHRAKSLGADILINYRTAPDWAAAAKQALGGSKIDILVDVAGTRQLGASVGLLREDGMIAGIGMLDGDFSWSQDIGRPITPVSVGTRNQHEAMLAFAAKHNIRPVVDIVYDLDRLPQALRHQESGQFFGKIGINLI